MPTNDIDIAPGRNGIGFQVLGTSLLLDQLDDIHDQFGGDVEYAVGSPLDYSVYQEFGSAQNPPHPFLVPAMESANRNATSILGRHDDFDRGVRAIAERVQQEAKSNAPVDTGQLRDSINLRKVK